MGFSMNHDFLCVLKHTQYSPTVCIFYLWCGVSLSIHLHIKTDVMCLRLYAKFEGVLQESSMK